MPGFLICNNYYGQDAEAAKKNKEGGRGRWWSRSDRMAGQQKQKVNCFLTFELVVLYKATPGEDR